MFPGMKEIVDLLDEADEARLLAADVEDPASVGDLLKYAGALEAEAARVGAEAVQKPRRENAVQPYRIWPLVVMNSEIGPPAH
jgi:hypothetical protein